MEQEDLRFVEPDLARGMFEDLKLTRQRMLSQAEENDAAVQLSPEELRRLESLGYAG